MKIYKIDIAWDGYIVLHAKDKVQAQEIFQDMTWDEVYNAMRKHGIDESSYIAGIDEDD